MATVTRLHVNGRDLPLEAEADRTLLSVLRDDLQLTGCKPGCGEGQCGACTVLVDGKPVRSCRTPAGSVGEAKIRTIEGLEQDVHERAVEVNRLENSADDVHDEALRRLFEEERDAITLIKWKEVLDLLEEATDRCEDVANVLESVVVKHG